VILYIDLDWLKAGQSIAMMKLKANAEMQTSPCSTRVYSEGQ
jgi:hypothetical protein